MELKVETERGPIEIRCDPKLIEEVRFLALEAFHKVPKGGLEIAGVIYGRRYESTVEALEFRELECEHACGPALRLTAGDRERFERLVTLPARERELGGLEPVGWFRSLSRSGEEPGHEDLALHRRYFTEAGHFLLILKPARARPVRARFWVNAGPGRLEPQEEVDISPMPSATRRAQLTAARTAGEGQKDNDSKLPPSIEDSEQARSPEEDKRAPRSSSELELAEDGGKTAGGFGTKAERRKKTNGPEAVASAALPSGVSEEETGRGRARAWLLWAISGWIAAAGSLGYSVWERWMTREGTPLQIGLYDLDGQLTIGWDRSRPDLKKARSARLEIQDGARKITTELTTELLGKGTAIYQRQSGDVGVRLVVQTANGRSIEGTARFVGQSLPSGTPSQQLEDLRREVEKLRRELAERTERTKELQAQGAAPKRTR